MLIYVSDVVTDCVHEQAVEDEEGKGTTVADDMYVFEGTNYAQEATIADKAVFDQLVAGTAVVMQLVLCYTRY